jgi:biotin carboxylase
MIKLLVANRGEIAVGIMATASVLGIDTVAVYAADDAACGHVGRADAVVELPGTGPAPTSTSMRSSPRPPARAATCCTPDTASDLRAAAAGRAPGTLALFGDKGAARF